MQFGEIKLEQRDIIEGIRKKYGHNLLSHSFCTLLLWKETLKLLIHLEEDFYIVKCEIESDNTYFFPCGDDEKKRKFIEEHQGEEDFTLLYLCEGDMLFLEKYFPDIVVEYDRNSCEYIFDKNSHIELKGKTYAKLRYEQNHLCNNYMLRSEKIDDKNAEWALGIVNEWESRHIRQNDLPFDDYIVAKNAFKYYKEMHFIGNVVYLDEQPYAVAIGGKITDDTYGIQVAKMKEPVAGLMFYLLHKCFELIPEQYMFINGDDDMGDSGIRIHKQKMKPCKMNEVWRAYVDKK